MLQRAECNAYQSMFSCTQVFVNINTNLLTKLSKIVLFCNICINNLRCVKGCPQMYAIITLLLYSLRKYILSIFYVTIFLFSSTNMFRVLQLCFSTLSDQLVKVADQGDFIIKGLTQSGYLRAVRVGDGADVDLHSDHSFDFMNNLIMLKKH